MMKPSPAEGLSSVKILMGKGEIIVNGSPGDQILITGYIKQDAEPSFTVGDNQLVVNSEGSASTDTLEIDLPININLEIEAFDVNMLLIGLQGNITIRNTAGDLTLDDFFGEANLWAGRGDINLKGGEGKAVVIGEHGTLHVSKFSGPVSMTTIMGHILFEGAENSQGDVLLEVDHGPVQAILPEDTDYQVVINSTSGETVCSGGNIRSTITGCIGSTGDGSSDLKIRTVSGRIEFQILSGSGK